MSQHNQQENLRKMLAATWSGMYHVALIKIAERTCALRQVKDAPREKLLTSLRVKWLIFMRRWLIDLG